MRDPVSRLLSVFVHTLHTTVHLQLALAWWEVMADWVPEGEVAGAARPRMEAGAAFGDRSSAQV